MLRYSMLPACVSHSHSGDDNDPSKSQAAFRRASISTVFRNTCNVMDTDEQSQCTASAQDIAKARPRTPLELQPQPSQDLLQSQFSQELFCTPVEQIDNDMSGNNSGSVLNVSPRRLVKRPRPVGMCTAAVGSWLVTDDSSVLEPADGEQDTCSQHSHSSRSQGEPSTSSRNTSGNTADLGVGAVLVMIAVGARCGAGFTHVLPPKPRQGRPRSPMYRNPFLSEDDEKTESRPTSRQPRFPQTKSRFRYYIPATVHAPCTGIASA